MRWVSVKLRMRYIEFEFHEHEVEVQYLYIHNSHNDTWTLMAVHVDKQILGFYEFPTYN